MPNRLPVKKSGFKSYLIPAIVLLLGLILFGVWRITHRVNLAEFIEGASEKKYNILLITIDTLSKKSALLISIRWRHPEPCFETPPRMCP
jgi:hypothetical protein